MQRKPHSDYLERAEYSRDNGMIDHAIQDYTYVIDATPVRGPGNNKQSVAEAYYGRAIAYAEQGSISEAVRDYCRSMTLYNELIKQNIVGRSKITEIENSFTQFLSQYEKRTIIGAIKKLRREEQQEIFTSSLQSDNTLGKFFSKQEGMFPTSLSLLGGPVHVITNILKELQNTTGAIPGTASEFEFSDESEEMDEPSEEEDDELTEDVIKNKLQRLTEDIENRIEADKDKKQIALLYLERGTWFSKQGDVYRAIADFTQAIKNDSQLLEAYFRRGLLLLNQEVISGNLQYPTERLGKRWGLALAVCDLARVMELSENQKKDDYRNEVNKQLKYFKQYMAQTGVSIVSLGNAMIDGLNPNLNRNLTQDEVRCFLKRCANDPLWNGLFDRSLKKIPQSQLFNPPTSKQGEKQKNKQDGSKSSKTSSPGRSSKD